MVEEGQEAKSFVTVILCEQAVISNNLCLLVDDHGVHGEMRNDAMNVASVALETNQEEKDISRHIKVVEKYIDRVTLIDSL